MNLLTLTGPAALIVDAVLKGTLFLALLFLVSPVLHRLSAGARHVVWGAGIVLLIALPLLSRVVPWRIGVLPAVATSTAAEPRQDGRTSAPSGDQPTTNAGAPTPVTSATPRTPNGGLSLPKLGMGTLALIVWMTGVLFALARLAVAQRSANKLVAGARPVQGEGWEEPKELAAARLGLERAPEVMITSALPLPVTTGLRHPVVLLPMEAEEWPADRRESVLLHEMAHVRRWDLATHLAARLVCAAWWFHPLAWRALGRFRAESERAADDLVLAAGRRASEYAQDLLAVVQSAGRSRAPVHALAMAQRSDFEGRLLAILEPGASRRGVTPMTAIPLVLAVSLAALPLAAIGPARAQLREPPVAATPAAPAAPAISSRPPVPAAPEHFRSTTEVVRSTHTTTTTRSAAIESMAQSRGAVVALIGLLHDADVDVRRETVQALGQLGDTTAVAALAQALTSDSDAGVRRAAAWALGQLQENSAVPALTAALKRDHDLEVRRTAAWALGQIQDGSSVEALTSVLTDPDTELRAKAVWALGQIQDSRSVAALIPVLRDRDPDTRAQAAWALGQIQSKDAVEGLNAATSDSSAHMRSQVAWALGQIQDARSVPALSRLLRDPAADVRKQAVWALGQIQSKDAVGALGDALHDSNADVRKQAAWALGQIQDPGSASVLVSALKDEDSEVKKNAAWALGQLDLRQIPQGLIDAFGDGNAEVRKNAAWAAGQISDAAAIPGLTRLLADTDRDVQKNALWALGQIDDPRALDGITTLLRSNDAELRRLAAQALGHGGH